MYFDFRLPITAFLVWLDLAIYIKCSPKPPIIVGIIFLEFIVLFAIYSRSLAVFAVIIITLSFLSVTVEQSVFFPKQLVHDKEIVKQYDVKIVSNVSLVESRFGGSKKCSFQVEASSRRISGHFYLTAVSDSQNWCQAKYGEIYSVSGSISDDKYHLRNFGSLKITKVQKTKDANIINLISNDFRNKTDDALKNVDSTTRSLLLGFSVGDTHYMSSDQKDELKVAGLTHLSAISGTHFMIILSIFGGVFLLLFPRKLAVLFQIVFILLFVFLVHPTDSVKRASVMCLLALISVYIGRRSVSLCSLAFAIIMFLLFDPYMAVSVSFLLSCLATCGIILFSEPVTKFLSKYLGEKTAEVLAIPLVAFSATLPVITSINHYLTPYAVLANILVLPAVLPAVFLSFVSVLVSGIFGGSFGGLFEKVCINLDSIFLHYISFIAHFVTKLPFAKIEGDYVSVAIFYILIILIYLAPKVWEFSYKKTTKKLPPQTLRKWQKVAQLFDTKPIVVVLILGLFIFPPMLKIYASENLGWFKNIPDDWLVVACPVGQGDSSLIRTGQNSAVVVDVGPNDRSTGGVGIRSCLKTLKITNVDMLILSHFHADHVGDLSSLLQTVPVKDALLNKYESPKINADQVKRSLQNYQISFTSASAGLQKSFGNCNADETTNRNEKYCVKMKVMSAYLPNVYSSVNKHSSGESSDENDSSIAVMFWINNVSYFTAGDLEIKGSSIALSELKREGLKNVDVLKVNHHGSKTQLISLEKHLSPKVAIYMDGKNNYGHPNLETISDFEKLGAISLRTDTDGMVGVSRNEQDNLVYFREKGEY